MIDEKTFVRVIFPSKIREHAIDLAQRWLKERGWFLVENEQFDVLAINSRSERIILKFWIMPDKRPVPKHFIKNFDREAQKFIHENGIVDLTRVYIISNAVLDDDAYGYYTSVARHTMKLVFAANDIAEQVSRLHVDDDEQKHLHVQKHLHHYMLA
nr:hypothetical protein [Candidatus Sigynarchaeota archaeon]